MAWNYQREESGGFNTKITEGQHRIRIKSAEKAVSKKGSDMLVLQFDVSGYNETIYHYIVNNEYANRNLTQFFDSFKDIPEGDFTLANWIGKVGACKVKHEEYNGNINAKVSYFIKSNKQDSLPPWNEPQSAVKEADSGFMSVPDGYEDKGLPFD